MKSYAFTFVGRQ